MDQSEEIVYQCAEPLQIKYEAIMVELLNLSSKLFGDYFKKHRWQILRLVSDLLSKSNSKSKGKYDEAMKESNMCLTSAQRLFRSYVCFEGGKLTTSPPNQEWPSWVLSVDGVQYYAHGLIAHFKECGIKLDNVDQVSHLAGVMYCQIVSGSNAYYGSKGAQIYWADKGGKTGKLMSVACPAECVYALNCKNYPNHIASSTHNNTTPRLRQAIEIRNALVKMDRTMESIQIDIKHLGLTFPGGETVLSNVNNTSDNPRDFLRKLMQQVGTVSGTFNFEPMHLTYPAKDNESRLKAMNEYIKDAGMVGTYEMAGLHGVINSDWSIPKRLIPSLPNTAECQAARTRTEGKIVNLKGKLFKFLLAFKATSILASDIHGQKIGTKCGTMQGYTIENIAGIARSYQDRRIMTTEEKVKLAKQTPHNFMLFDGDTNMCREVIIDRQGVYVMTLNDEQNNKRKRDGAALKKSAEESQAEREKVVKEMRAKPNAVFFAKSFPSGKEGEKSNVGKFINALLSEYDFDHLERFKSYHHERKAYFQTFVGDSRNLGFTAEEQTIMDRKLSEDIRLAVADDQGWSPKKKARTAPPAPRPTPAATGRSDSEMPAAEKEVHVTFPGKISKGGFSGDCHNFQNGMFHFLGTYSKFLIDMRYDLNGMADYGFSTANPTFNFGTGKDAEGKYLTCSLFYGVKDFSEGGWQASGDHIREFVRSIKGDKELLLDNLRKISGKDFD